MVLVHLERWLWASLPLGDHTLHSRSGAMLVKTASSSALLVSPRNTISTMNIQNPEFQNSRTPEPQNPRIKKPPEPESRILISAHADVPDTQTTTKVVNIHPANQKGENQPAKSNCEIQLASQACNSIQSHIALWYGSQPFILSHGWPPQGLLFGLLPVLHGWPDVLGERQVRYAALLLLR